jgi:hypothetical protein
MALVATRSRKAKPLPEKFDRAALDRYIEPSYWAPSVEWDVAKVRKARMCLMLGDFRVAADLAEAVKTDPQVYGAMLNRICPHRGLPLAFEADGERVRREAEETFGDGGTAVPAAVEADAYEWMVQLGVSVEQVVWTPREDGSRIDARLETWPMSSVWYDSLTGTLKTITGTSVETIEHGNGKWVVTKLHSSTPWQWGAVKPIGMAWAMRAHHIRDRALNSESHGESKPIITLPEGVKPTDPEGEALIALAAEMRSRRSGGGIPFGSKLALLESMAGNYQIFSIAIKSLDTDIARAYLGQDGSLVNEGGNYVKTALLFGVRNDLVEGDMGARAYALNTGLYRPWSMVNFGRDWRVKSARQFPDADQDARRESYGKRTDAFNKAIREYRANGFVVDQTVADELAREFGVKALRLQAEGA